MTVQQLSSVTEALVWLRQRGVTSLCTDSRRVQPGSAFIAWPGYAVDGRQFVAAACAAGASACLIEADGAQAYAFDDAAPVASLFGLKAATGELASLFEGHPSQHLVMAAVTGTNGKTSTAWWMAQALTALGRRCGVIGTLGVGEPRSQALVPTGLTTPDPVMLQTALRRYVDEGFSACAMEASSIGLQEQRLSGTQIDVALFTNFTQDHLDYHGSMQAYWSAKATLFAWPGLRAAVVNVDDEYGRLLAQSLQSMQEGGLALWTYAKNAPARLHASQVRSHAGTGLSFLVHEGAAQWPVNTGLIGDYNVSNLLAVMGALRALDVPLEEAVRVCQSFTSVPGRMQRVSLSADVPTHSLPEVVVDYAHTPDALQKALEALQGWAAERGGVLWCVFGCGGNRDATKRPLMGAVAQAHAQQVVVTSDNPRDENPASILSQIVQGMQTGPTVVCIEDRQQAIAHAVQHAQAGDVILLAGKGHEDTQEIAGRKWPFSDVAQAQAALQRRAAQELPT